MAYVKPITPNGVNPILKEDRMPVIKVINGDSWHVDAEIYNPVTYEPATPENTKLVFKLAENRFVSKPFWVGDWETGIKSDDVIPGLVHISIPDEISSALRRGVYEFSLKVTDISTNVDKTELIGYFQVEYEPTSDTHDIPYRDRDAIKDTCEQEEDVE